MGRVAESSQNMDLVLPLAYVGGWAFVFATTTPALRIVKHRIDDLSLPLWIRGRHGEKFAFAAGVIAFLSAISLVSWGAWHLAWYAMLAEWFGGLLISGILQQFFSIEMLLSLGPPSLLFVNVALWTFGS